MELPPRTKKKKKQDPRYSTLFFKILSLQGDDHLFLILTTYILRSGVFPNMNEKLNGSGNEIGFKFVSSTTSLSLLLKINRVENLGESGRKKMMLL